MDKSKVYWNVCVMACALLVGSGHAWAGSVLYSTDGTATPGHGNSSSMTAWTMFIPTANIAFHFTATSTGALDSITAPLSGYSAPQPLFFEVYRYNGPLQLPGALVDSVSATATGSGPA